MARQKIDLTNENQSPFKVILWLAWPLFLEQILSTLVSYADTAMVGALGVNATASVSISNSFVFLLNGVVIAMGVGLTAYVARSVGAKDYEAAKAYIRHALLLLLMLSLPMALVVTFLHRQIPMWMGAEPEIMEDASAYLLITSIFRVFTMAMMVLGSVFRGRGDTKTPLRINIFVNIINVVGNYLLINPSHTIELGSLSIPMIGAGMGVRGAALSTGISWLVGGLWLGIALFVKKDPTRISIRESYKPDIALIKRVVKLSFPAMLERLCISSAGIVVTKTIATLGTVAVAANSVYLTAESISYMPAFAFATSVTTLVGQSLGAKKPDLAIRYTWHTIGISTVLMVIAGVLLYIFAEPLVRIFTPDEEAIELAKRCLQITAFIQPIQAAAWIFAGGLRGAGDTKWPFYFTAICNWGIRTLGSVICIIYLHMSLPAAVLCTCGDNAMRCLLNFLRFRHGGWKHAIDDQKKKEAQTA